MRPHSTNRGERRTVVIRHYHGRYYQAYRKTCFRVRVCSKLNPNDGIVLAHTPARARCISGERNSMKLIAYQALLSNPQSIARVQAFRREVERIGGHLTLAPPTRMGMVLVILELPEGHSPDQFFPGMPFYPM